MNNIAFLGAGSMAEAMIAGIRARSADNQEVIWVLNRNNKERLTFLNNAYSVQSEAAIETFAQKADILFLAVKPKDVFQALSSVRDHLRKDTLLISVAAGVSIDTLEMMTSSEMAVIRCMPNTSAAVGKSATALAHNKQVTKEQLQRAISLLETIGLVTIVSENQLDAVTGLSGSGPAYIYYLTEAMERAAKETGLREDEARELILQTIAGAAEMLKQSDKTPATLRKEVTSPGGTTEAGIKVLEDRSVQESFVDCIKEATRQSKRLGDQINQDISAKTLIK